MGGSSQTAATTRIRNPIRPPRRRRESRTSGGRPVAAAAWGLDREYLIRREFGLVGAAEDLAHAVGALDPLLARGAVLAAIEPERRHVATRCDDDRRHRLQKADAA